MRCENCGSKLIKYGHRYNKSSTKQVYKCSNCSTKATKHSKYKHYPAGVTVMVQVMYKQGYTYREIKNKLDTEFENSPVVSTIHSWCKK